MDETGRRRIKQDIYNKANGIVPTALIRSKESILAKSSAVQRNVEYEVSKVNLKAAEKAMNYATPEDLETSIRKIRKDMEVSAKSMDFIEAARLRDVLIELESKREKR
jgi:excinuclease ABC subunit B